MLLTFSVGGGCSYVKADSNEFWDFTHPYVQHLSDPALTVQSADSSSSSSSFSPQPKPATIFLAMLCCASVTAVASHDVAHLQQALHLLPGFLPPYQTEEGRGRRRQPGPDYNTSPCCLFSFFFFLPIQLCITPMQHLALVI